MGSASVFAVWGVGIDHFPMTSEIMKQHRAKGTPLQKDQQSKMQQLGLNQVLPLSLTCHSLGCYL